MPITTWIPEYEASLMKRVKDEELGELFQEINGLFDGKYLIRERDINYRRRWFTKLKTRTVYTLYLECTHEYQIINFPQSHEWSINTSVDKSYIMTYFFGLINGRKISNP